MCAGFFQGVAMKRMLWLLLLLVVPAQAAENSGQFYRYMDQHIKVRQRELKEVLVIAFGSDKIARDAGIDDQELTAWAVLKFKNSFAGSDLTYTGDGESLTPALANNLDKTSVLQKGGIEITLQTALQPQSKLIAYTIQLNLFSQDCAPGMVLYDKPSTWNARFVGLVAKAKLLEQTKKNIADLMGQAALDLQRVKGQLSTRIPEPCFIYL
jgi:hypothetical protein